MSKNVPTNKSLYSRVKSEAKQKFDRWPSAYGSAWLVKEYKRRGGGYRKAEQGMEVPEENFAGYMPADMDEYALGGGIPERYKNMGFNKVGVKKESNRPGKKWMVLAKKGDKYKVVHGGYKGMKDFTQHGSEKRKDRFWDRMGGRDSAKAKDPFSPLYWHKKFGTWAEGGEPQNEGFQALPPYVQAKIMANKMYGGTMYAAGGEMFNEDSQDFYQQGGQKTLYEFVQAAGYNPSFASRKELLGKYVQGEYTGSAEQNMELLRKLKSGEIKLDGAKTKSTSTPPKKTTTTSSKPATKGDRVFSVPNGNDVALDSDFPQSIPGTENEVFVPQTIMDSDSDQRRLPQTGVVVDRGTNQAFILGNNDVTSFNVLTGRSTDPSMVYSPAGIVDRRNNAQLAVTPTGYFTMDAGVGSHDMEAYDGNIRTLNSISAYGVPEVPALTNGARVAMHQTYNPSVRDAYYDMGPEDRRASQGCINCSKEDYMRMAAMVNPSDTLFVFDSRRPEDQRFLDQAQARRQEATVSRLRNPAFDTTSYADATYVAPVIRPYAMGGWIQEAKEDMQKNGTVGAFTKQARREGYDDVQEFAGYVLENPAQFTPTTKKRAQFAKNMGKLQKAMHGMELQKYQFKGQTPEPLPLDLLDEQNNQKIELPIKSPAQIWDFSQNQLPAIQKASPIAAIQEDMSNSGPVQNEDGTYTFSYTGYGYEPMGSKDDPWWQRGAAIGAYAPGIIANQINSATDNRREAVARTKNNLTDYTDNVIRQGLALSRGEREMNTDQLDVVNRTPVQFENYFQDGGESFVDQSILEALIAAGADIEILD